MTALLQFEIDRKRLSGYANFFDRGGQHTPIQHIYQLANTALLDTFDNCGTLVIVVSKEKITIVQRAEADDV